MPKENPVREKTVLSSVFDVLSFRCPKEVSQAGGWIPTL